MENVVQTRLAQVFKLPYLSCKGSPVTNIQISLCFRPINSMKTKYLFVNITKVCFIISLQKYSENITCMRPMYNNIKFRTL